VPDILIDPELRQVAALQPVVDYADPARVRATLRRAQRLATALRPDGPADVASTEFAVPARAGAPAVPVRCYRSAHRSSPGPALVFCHGGAFVAGDLDTEDARCREIAARTGVLVLSVDYRLAPEHPFPAGFQDCSDVLRWTVEHAAELGVDAASVAVGGSSAGGALAAAVALAARDAGGPHIAFQLLLYPVIDDRLRTASMAMCTATPGWNQPNSVHMWRHYLGADRDAVSPYAAPGRATDLSGLPGAYVLTAEFDPLRDEGIEYARRLIDADVPTELHVLPGAFHGFDAAAPHSELGSRALAEQCAVLARALGAK
jgi:acetyl esterase/lipase